MTPPGLPQGWGYCRLEQETCHVELPVLQGNLVELREAVRLQLIIRHTFHSTLYTLHSYRALAGKSVLVPFLAPALTVPATVRRRKTEEDRTACAYSYR